jgi:hypothetical protein
VSGKWSEALHPRGPGGKFKSKSDRQAAKHNRKATKLDNRAAGYRASAAQRTKFERDYVRATGDRNSAAGTQKLRAKNQRDLQKANELASRAYVHRSAARDIKRANRTPAQKRRAQSGQLAALQRMERRAVVKG